MIKNYKNFMRLLGLVGVVAIFLIFPSAILAAEVPCTSSGSVFIFCKFTGGTCTNAPLPEDQKNNASAYCSQFQSQFVACADSISPSPGICQLQEPGCCKMKQDVNTVGCSDGPAQNCAVPPNIFLPGASCSTYSDCAGKTQAATPTGCCQMQGSCSDNITQKDCANTNANNTWAQGQYCSQGCKSPTTSGSSGGGLKTVETNFTPVKPLLQINIPTVNFSDIKVQGETGSRYVDIPYLAEYIKGTFNYALGFLAMLAVIMIMIGGVKYIMARGGGGVGEAKKMIGNAFFGLILGLASYVILNAVSPSLTNLSTIRTPVVERIVYEFDEEKNLSPESVDASNSEAAGSGASIAKIIGAYQGAPCSLQGAQTAATALTNAQVCVGPCHCAWTAVNFLKYIGCGDLQAGNKLYAFPFGAMKSAIDLGWVAQIIPDDRSNLPPGLISTQGGAHAVASIGGGMIFESGGKGGGGGGGGTIDAFASCGGPWQDQVAHPENCRVCAKLTGGHEPFSTAFRGNRPYFANPGCNNTQFWIKRSIGNRFQNGIIIAPPQSFAQAGFKVTNNPVPVTVAVKGSFKKGNATTADMSLDAAVCDNMGPENCQKK